MQAIGFDLKRDEPNVALAGRRGPLKVAKCAHQQFGCELHSYMPTKVYAAMFALLRQVQAGLCGFLILVPAYWPISILHARPAASLS